MCPVKNCKQKKSPFKYKSALMMHYLTAKINRFQPIKYDSTGRIFLKKRNFAKRQFTLPVECVVLFSISIMKQYRAELVLTRRQQDLFQMN
jgi:hypothetical protein